MNTQNQSKISAQLERIAKYGTDNIKTAVVPFNTLGAEIVNKLHHLNGEILVVSDIGLLFTLLSRMHKEAKSSDYVTFVAHTEQQQSFAKMLKIKTINIGYENPIKELEAQFMGMKFDIIVGNPPYGKLHLPLLKICIEHLTNDGICTTIQPIRWLQDPLCKVKTSSDAQKYHSIFNGKLDSIKIVSSAEATKIFNAEFTMDLGIFVFKNDGGNFDYYSLANERFGKKLGNTMKILRKSTLIKKSKMYDYSQKNFFPFIGISIMGGSGRGLGVTTSANTKYGYFVDGKSVNCKYGNNLTPDECMAANTRATTGSVKNWLAVEFETAHELKNFYEYVNLPAFRFYVWATTLDVNVQRGYLPFPEDSDAFSTAWSNERFYEHFGLSKDDIMIIEQTVKEIL